MVEVDLKTLQNIELEILDEFVRICEKHHLKYFLMAGTALGAIRHHGFIPWDDDIDVGMPREDYEKLIKIASSDLRSDYFFQNYHSEKNCGLIFGKIRKSNTILSENYSHHIDMHQGVWIDIFPYDNIGLEPKVSKIDSALIMILKNIYIVKCGYKMPENRSKYLLPFYYLTKMIAVFFSYKFLITKLDHLMKKRNTQASKYVYPRGSGYGSRDIMSKEVIENLIEVDFEGRKLKIFKEYDHYLTSIYGDYMQLPPVDKRRNTSCHFLHEFKSKI